MKELVDIKSLYEFSKNETDEDLENLDMIYYGVTDEEYTFRLEDIVPLCELQIQNYSYMEPHQETKIMEMVYYVINEYGVSAGLPELIKGFEKIIEIKGFLIGMYLRMMFNSYSEEDILQFANLLISCPRTFKNEIKKTYTWKYKNRLRTLWNKRKYYFRKVGIIKVRLNISVCIYLLSPFWLIEGAIESMIELNSSFNLPLEIMLAVTTYGYDVNGC